MTPEQIEELRGLKILADSCKNLIPQMEQELVNCKTTLEYVDKRIQLLEKAQPKEEQPRLERWKPKEGERYWFINAEGIICYNTHHSDSPIAATVFDSMNYFSTQAEAEKEALRTRARRKLEWMARELREVTPHVNNTDYFFIDVNDKGFYTINDLICPRLGTFAFHSREDADYALSQMTDKELEALR